jgi:ferric-dicitrate binding protein FerR (iron transport regulator)
MAHATAGMQGGMNLVHGWEATRREADPAVDRAAERSRAAHGTESGVSTRAVMLALGSVLLLVLVAGLAIWAGASFSGGEPGLTAPAYE